MFVNKWGLQHESGAMYFQIFLSPLFLCFTLVGATGRSPLLRQIPFHVAGPNKCYLDILQNIYGVRPENYKAMVAAAKKYGRWGY
jgi:hypothetical protein